MVSYRELQQRREAGRTARSISRREAETELAQLSDAEIRKRVAPGLRTSFRVASVEAKVRAFKSLVRAGRTPSEAATIAKSFSPSALDIAVSQFRISPQQRFFGRRKGRQVTVEQALSRGAIPKAALQKFVRASELRKSIAALKRQASQLTRAKVPGEAGRQRAMSTIQQRLAAEEAEIRRLEREARITIAAQRVEGPKRVAAGLVQAGVPEIKRGPRGELIKVTKLNGKTITEPITRRPTNIITIDGRQFQIRVSTAEELQTERVALRQALRKKEQPTEEVTKEPVREPPVSVDSTEPPVSVDSTEPPVSVVSPVVKPEKGLERAQFEISQKEAELETKVARGEELTLEEQIRKFGLGFGGAAVRTGIFVKSLVTKPKETTAEVVLGLKEIVRRIRTKEFFPEIGEKIRTDPEGTLGIAAFELLFAKGVGEAPKVIGIGRARLGKKAPTDIKVAPPGIGKITESLSTQVGLAGKRVTAVTAARDLFKKTFGKEEVIVETPRLPPGSPELRRALFFDPRGRLRESRLKIQPEASIIDILAGGDITLKKAGPQAVFIREAKISPFPKSLKKVEVKLLSDRPLTTVEKAKLEKFLLTPTGKLKVPGFLSREAEAVLAPGEIIVKKKFAGAQVIKETRVPFFEAEIKQATARTKELLGKTKLTKPELKELKGRLRKETGFEVSTSLVEDPKALFRPTGPAITVKPSEGVAFKQVTQVSPRISSPTEARPFVSPKGFVSRHALVLDPSVPKSIAPISGRSGGVGGPSSVFGGSPGIFRGGGSPFGPGGPSGPISPGPGGGGGPISPIIGGGSGLGPRRPIGRPRVPPPLFPRKFRFGTFRERPKDPKVKKAFAFKPSVTAIERGIFAPVRKGRGVTKALGGLGIRPIPISQRGLFQRALGKGRGSVLGGGRSNGLGMGKKSNANIFSKKSVKI